MSKLAVNICFVVVMTSFSLDSSPLVFILMIKSSNSTSKSIDLKKLFIKNFLKNLVDSFYFIFILKLIEKFLCMV